MPNNKNIIQTSDAPAAIGAYSQAVIHGDVVFVSGQIPLNPENGEIVSDDVREQIDQVFRNLIAVARAAGGEADDFIKLSVFLTDLSCFPTVNTIMETYFTRPFPARAAVQVSALPKGVKVEVEGILSLKKSI